MWRYAIVLVIALGSGNSENSTLSDTCDGDDGPFSLLLEEWATADIAPHRQGRVMALPPTKGYYVTERIDMPLVPPPPPHSHQGSPQPSYGPPRPIPLQNPNYANTNGPMSYNGPHGYKEWEKPPGNGKIVNKPPNKDKFRPSYQQQPPSRPAPPAPAADRADEPPRKQVTETDLYLLSAIEKLVWRADLMEKRLRKLEESMHVLVAGAEPKPEPCEGNYTRVGGVCYSWWGSALDWQGASKACRKDRAALLELPPATRRQLQASLLADPQLKGKDFWTGGLNPGLLWIWSHSAKPVEASNSTTIVGEGRCLALVYDPTRNDYVFRGQDCALRHRYICQKEDDKTKLSNEIQKAARMLQLDRTRQSKLLWDDDVEATVDT